MQPARIRMRLVCLACVPLFALTGASRPEPLVGDAEIRAAVDRGLSLVEKAATNYPQHRTCFSCHHQTLPMLAVVRARQHGRTVAPDLLQEQAEFTAESFREKTDSMAEGKGVGGGAMTVGYSLWAFALAKYPRDTITDSMVSFLLRTQKPEGHWSVSSRRPPLEESSITGVMLALDGMSRYAPPEKRKEVDAAIARARKWLVTAPVKNQEDRNARLRGLCRMGAPAETILEAKQAVLSTQRADGGWPARDDLESDAYATGQTLAWLEEAGVPTTDPHYQRGLRFLIDSQLDDGSWKVETRAKPVQVYFDNGDPHGKHQFISTPATAWAVAALAVSLQSAPAEAPFDLLIRGGRIVDGTGNPWFFGDLGLKGDRIVAVGRIPAEAKAGREIDARGLVVAPGFIDMHSHSDRPLLEDGAAQSKIRQGVTTEVLGEDSSGGPARGERKPERAEFDGKTREWTTLGGYFKVLEERGIAVNVASYVGLGTLLGCVLGDSLDRPNAEQLDRMKTLLDEAMKDGAIGLSTMLAGARELNVTTDDLVELCRVVKRHGGIFSSHIRNEGTGVVDAVKEAIAVGERAQVPVDVIHIKIADQSLWGRMSEVVALIEAARQRGVNIQANIYPYTRGNNDLVTIIPPWAHEGGKAALLERLADPVARRRLKDEIRQGVPGWYNHYTAVGGDWSRMLVSARLSPANERFQGMTVDRIFQEKALGLDPRPDPLDQLFDFLIEEHGSIGTIYAHHTEEDMNLALSQPWTSIGSDGSALAVEGSLRRGNPHPRSFGTFPRVLGVYVRERGFLSLEDAIRKMTSLNANKIGVFDRGVLRSGMVADVTVFDPKTVIDRSTYLAPFAYGEGIEYVIVGGRVVLDRGKHTGARPGRALRHGG